jgi:hypothetical protein
MSAGCAAHSRLDEHHDVTSIASINLPATLDGESHINANVNAPASSQVALNVLLDVLFLPREASRPTLH